ncbi:hypothetical protein [Thorsellia anophelis]|uniref:Outer membrane lipoprotein LpoB, binds and activates PBP1b n=1 Tax=Thorsellia anophelis DSM 18579 TaxID=1123402 RepID=A0A1I0BLQ9_9GAMM|nr:hypothetical protein [Thorsellia anophelis]SET07926.1 Outer membrane lipoprotein LpoB, binds and activates PBP1b [Thorsellia anophelis DSM 18579]
MNNSYKYSKKAIYCIIPLSVSFILQGCNLNQNIPAPVEKIESNKKAASEMTQVKSQSYPLPPTPTIENNISVTIENVPSNPQINAPNAHVSDEGQLILDQIISDPNAVLNSASTTTPIAANSPVNISTQKQTINYIAPEGSPNWQAMSEQAFSSLNSSDQLSKLTSAIYINSISNQTNGSIPIFALDQIIQQSAFAKAKVQIADNQSINLAKQQLGVSPNDTLINRSKAIAIAKALNLNFVIYPSLSGDASDPILSLQLIDASSSEILAEGESKAIF